MLFHILVIILSFTFQNRDYGWWLMSLYLDFICIDLEFLLLLYIKLPTELINENPFYIGHKCWSAHWPKFMFFKFIKCGKYVSLVTYYKFLSVTYHITKWYGIFLSVSCLSPFQMKTRNVKCSAEKSKPICLFTVNVWIRDIKWYIDIVFEKYLRFNILELYHRTPGPYREPNVWVM